MYYFQRVDASTFSYSDALQCGELMTEAFKNAPLHRYAMGDKYALRSRTDIRQTIHDPVARLRAYLAQARVYDVHCRCWAISIWQKVLADDHDMFAVYEPVQGGPDRLVAMSLWRYPRYMEHGVKTVLGKASWQFRLWRLFMSVRLWIWRLLVLRGHEHPFYNQRQRQAVGALIGESNNPRMDEEQIAALQTQQEVDNAQYPRESMVELYTMATDPAYQRQGLGTMLLERSMDNIPDKQPVFILGENRSVQGPQKLYIESLEEGAPLYSKLGFETESQQNANVGGYDIQHAFMVLTRHRNKYSR